MSIDGARVTYYNSDIFHWNKINMLSTSMSRDMLIIATNIYINIKINWP